MNWNPGIMTETHKRMYALMHQKRYLCMFEYKKAEEEICTTYASPFSNKISPVYQFGFCLIQIATIKVPSHSKS